jgi:YebC/PmpR family DNA-binding regulatory protein
MSGHSKWATIKRQKGVNDAKRGQVFTRLGNAIAVAARNGADPSMNPNLAMAIDKAKAANMPNANIDRSIKRGTGELGGEQIQEYLFEGYGSSGVGIVVEAASDNRNRTTSEVRATFSKHGGHMAEPGSVVFQFERKGLIRLKSLVSDDLTLALLDAGAEDIQEIEGELLVSTEMKKLAEVRDNIKSLGQNIIDAELVYQPKHLVEVTDKNVSEKIHKLLESLEDLDDIINVYTNFEPA